MSWGSIAAAGIGAAGSIAGGALAGRGRKGGGVKVDWDAPAWYEDEYYKPTQDYLLDFGKGMLEGDIPDYFAPIGEIGGQEFEDFLDLTKRDVVDAVEESAIVRGAGRSGTTTSAVSKAVGDVSAQYRYADFQRALEGRKGFLNMGTGLVENVRGAGLSYGGQRNQFNLGVSSLALNKALGEAGLLVKQNAADQNFMSSLIGSGLEFAGGLAGTFSKTSGSGSDGTSLISRNLGSANPYGIGASALSYDAMFDKFKGF